MRFALAIACLCTSGCFAYYGFTQAPNPPTPVDLTLSPSQLTLFSGEQFTITASINSAQKAALNVSVDTPAFTCEPVTVEAGALSVELKCIAGTGSASADINVEGKGLKGSSTFSIEVLAGERFTLPTHAFKLKRGEQTTLPLSITTTPGFSNPATVELQSAEPTLMLTPVSIQTDSSAATLTFSVAGDAGTETPVTATLRITSAGKVTTLSIDATFVPRSGTIDTGFGTAGFALTDFNTNGNTYNQLKTIHVDSMGRVVVSGASHELVTTFLYSRPGIARLTPSGVLDTSYSSDGFALFAGPNPNKNYNLTAAVLDAQDELWLCGNYNFAYALVTRTSSSGSPLGSASRLSQNCAAIAVDGTRRVYAHTDENGNTAIGSVDASTLATTDLFTANFFGTDEGATAIAAATGGTYVLAGSSSVNGSAWIARISNPASNLADAAFGPSGLSIYSNVETLPYYQSILVSGSDIFAAGVSTPSGGQDALLTKTNLQSGQRDAQFGSGGVTTLGGGRWALSLAKQSDGKILLAGQTVTPGLSQAFVARMLPNGQPDTGFAPGGVITLPTPEAGHAMASAVTVAANGHIYVGISYACSERFRCADEGPNARSAVLAIWP